MPIIVSLPPVPTWTLKPVYDLRERFERRTDKDFTAASNDNRSDLYSRWRAGFEFTYGKQVSGRVTYQYADDLYWTAAGNGSKINSDLFEAYVDIKTQGGKVRAGRQTFGKGCERLFTYGDWGALGRSWDMARFTAGPWDLWAGRSAVSSTPCKETSIAGLSYTSKFGDTMFAYKHDEKAAVKDDIYTLAHRWTRTAGKWSYDVEGAVQAGRVSANKLEAWAGAARATYQATPKVSIYGEADIASGGKRGNTVLTFDQVFAGNHGKYGIVDAQGWRNMKGLTLGATYKPNAKTWLTVEYDKFGLYAANDAWYGDSGKINKGNGFNFSDPTGANGTDVGDEFDLSGGYKLNANFAFDGGIGIFRPGKFVKSFAGAGDKDQVWMYVQCRIRF